MLFCSFRISACVIRPWPVPLQALAKSHTHPSHSQTSRLLTSSLSLGVPVPLTTQCIRWEKLNKGYHLARKACTDFNVFGLCKMTNCHYERFFTVSPPAPSTCVRCPPKCTILQRGTWPTRSYPPGCCHTLPAATILPTVSLYSRASSCLVGMRSQRFEKSKKSIFSKNTSIQFPE